MMIVRCGVWFDFVFVREDCEHSPRGGPFLVVGRRLHEAWGVFAMPSDPRLYVPVRVRMSFLVQSRNVKTSSNDCRAARLEDQITKQDGKAHYIVAWFAFLDFLS